MSPSRTVFTDSPIFCELTVTEEVSTSPSGPPSVRRAAALAAESVPMLVPTSHTGTGAISRSAVITCLMSSACSFDVRQFHSSTRSDGVSSTATRKPAWANRPRIRTTKLLRI